MYIDIEWHHSAPEKSFNVTSYGEEDVNFMKVDTSSLSQHQILKSAFFSRARTALDYLQKDIEVSENKDSNSSDQESNDSKTSTVKEEGLTRSDLTDINIKSFEHKNASSIKRYSSTSSPDGYHYILVNNQHEEIVYREEGQFSLFEGVEMIEEDILNPSPKKSSEGYSLFVGPGERRAIVIRYDF